MKKLICKYILIVVAVFPFFANLLAQPDSQPATITVTAVIMDQEGKPLENVSVYANDGAVREKTRSDGRFSMTVKIGSVILLEADGYETFRFNAIEEDVPPITLKTLPIQMTESDLMHIPFGTRKLRHSVGSASLLNARDIMTYDSRNGVLGLLNGRVPGLFGNTDVYGIGAVIVVDGIIRDPAYLNLVEVDQIAVLRDAVSRMLYGSQSDQPVIMITTKRGTPFKRRMNAYVETGLQNPISYPNLLGAAEYMELFNEARENDNLGPRFDQTTIDNTRNGTDPVLYPDEDYFTSRYLKDYQTYTRVLTEASGGNDAAQYYAHIGWETQQGLMALGRRNDRSNQVNIRANVDYQINDYINMRFDGSTVFDFGGGPRGDFWNNTVNFQPHWYPVLIPASLLTDDELINAANLVDGEFLLGGTSEYQTNIYGDLVSAGYRNSMNRLLQFNTGLDFDLGFIAEGLTAKAVLSFDMFNRFDTEMQDEYAVYQPSVVQGMDGDSLIFAKIGQDVRQGSESVVNPDFYRRNGMYGTINYKKVIDDSRLDVTGLAYTDLLQLNDEVHRSRNLHYGIRANYSFKDRYIVELSGTVAGSPRFSKESRYAFSPGVGLGWVLSEEGIFANNSIVDYLKLKTSWAIIHTDVGVADYYLYNNAYQQRWWYDYNHGVVRNRVRDIVSIGNPDLSWIKREHLSLGFESLLLGKALWLEGGYFYSRHFDLITQRSNYYPNLMGGFYPYENYNSFRDHGFEGGVKLEKSVGELQFSISSNLVYSVPKVLQIDEPVYEVEDRQRLGQPTDAIFGLVAIGFFEDETDIANSPVQTFGTVRPGDIKYEDRNEDKKIDDNDMMIIGNNSARLQYSLEFRVRYRAFELFALGTGRTGQETIFSNPYYWVYGERRYSDVVLGRWTPETALTATYPALSSGNNANNFRNSTFWLEDNDWFTLHAVQLSFQLSERLTGQMFFKDLQLYLRSHNLVTISQVSEKRELNIGSPPQFRTYSVGINASF
jgi:TonB-linked SusC/RagA family outer membrane protein